MLDILIIIFIRIKTFKYKFRIIKFVYFYNLNILIIIFFKFKISRYKFLIIKFFNFHILNNLSKVYINLNNINTFECIFIIYSLLNLFI